MRLHALTMTAIGPYAETERVDFDALAGDGLFLFAGPTGAGKTTVLDAVTFALYGRLPGTREGQLSRLKSDFAAADVRPEVVLELTVGAERLRVHRSPSYERPKKRGDGTTIERASVAIERQVDGAWIGIEGARKENVANDWLVERIGLTCDQFTQVVLLPQGQFAEFLHAADDVREKLLVSLFNAHRFKDVEDWFDDRQRAEAAIAADAEQKVADLRTKAQTVADLGDDDLPERVDVEWFASLAAAVRARSDEAEIRVRVAARLHEEAAERVRAAEEVLRRQQELTEARRLHELVEMQRDDIATLRSRYERAVAAASVAPLLTELDRRRVAAARAAAQAATSREGLLATEPDLADQPVDAVRTRLRALTARRGALDEVIAAEREIAGQREALGSATSALADAEATLADVRARIAGLPAERTAASAALADLRERAAVLTDARAAVETLSAAVQAAKDARHTDARLLEARRYAVDRADEATAARETALDLRERRIAGMAAELAADLRDGQACAVCGSAEHPSPARRAGDAPTAEEVSAAEERVDTARKLRDVADKTVSEFAATLAAQRATAGGRSVAELKTGLAAARARVDAALEADGAIPEAIAAADAIEAKAARLADDERSADRLRDEHAGAVRELRVEVRRREKAIATERAGYDSVAERAAVIDRTVETIEAYLRDAAADTAAQDGVAQATASASEAALEAGFDSVDDAASSTWSKKTLADASAMISAFDRDAVSAATRLSDPRLADVPEEAPDLAGLREVRDEAKAEEHAARAVASAESDRAGRLTDLARRAARDLPKAFATASRAAEIKALSLLVRGMGANTKRMNLTAYYLAARLEQVTRVASGHLQRMSSGRFTLRHTDERRTARGHGGLGLEVFDAHTGRARAPHSLSGGETFYASVALALGLAEVVTAETGAMTLDSLFIDEGFGALDSETLDLAMQVLDDLRQVGRTIGVISHVEEMKTRITTQLVIERTPRGSRILAH